MSANAVETALYDALSGTSAITDLLGDSDQVYNTEIPRDATYPVVVFQFSAGGDEHLTPTRSRNPSYIVKAITQTSFEDAGDIDAQIDATLHHGTISVSGYTVYWLARDNDIRMQETTEQGDHYYHSGGFYRCRITKG